MKREFPPVTLDATVTKTVAKRRQTLPVKEEVVVEYVPPCLALVFGVANHPSQSRRVRFPIAGYFSGGS